MRLRLLRRRLTVSSPRLAIRSAMPWPLRWLLAAVVLGFSGALALWAFEFGRDIAGLDRHAKQELEQLRAEVQVLRSELGRAQSVANTSDSLLTTEKAAQQQLLQQIRQLEADNQQLRSDLGFFERLIPGSGTDALSIRGLQVERLSAGQLKWQVLMIQALKNAPDFKGGLEVAFTGTLDGRPWSMTQSPAPQPVLIKSYLRQEGVVDVPPQAVVKTVTAKILQGGTVKSVQTLKL
jgi:cell division protein FtsB